MTAGSGRPRGLRAAARKRLRSRSLRVWCLTAVVAAAAGALYGGPVRGAAEIASPVHVSWWGIAILFALTEWQVVHVQFRRQAHAFSLGEVPLVLGLFFCAPGDLILGQLVGAAVIFTLHRRQPPLKLIFNVSYFCFDAALAVVTFHLVVTTASALGPLGWAVTFAATGLSAVLGVVMVQTAISIAEGRSHVHEAREFVLPVLLGAATNTSLALVCVTVLWHEPSALWLLALPLVTVYLAYSAYTGERQKNESLQFLYESSRTLQRFPDVEPAIVSLLQHARQMFRAEVAEIVLFPSDDEEETLTSVVGPGDRVDQHRSRRGGGGDELARLVLRERRGLIVNRVGLDGYLRDRGLRDAVLVALRGEAGAIGSMLVGNRLGDLGSFAEGDVRLLETFAAHAGAAIENARLERRLQRQAFEDPLTKLANRALLSDRLDQAEARLSRDGQSLAVLLLDIDDFKSVNDSLGHAAGDSLLAGVGERLGAAVRPFDTVARIGGDEFAVLLEGVKSLADVTAVADRILLSLHEPFSIDGHDVCAGASIGVVLSRGDARPGELLLSADVAMYRAKSRGKGCYEIFEPTMQAAVVARQRLKEALEAAIGRDELEVHYQPFVDLRTSEVVAVEALARWRHPVRGMVAAAEFIPLAEETGLIIPIGRHVLAEACRRAAEWTRRRGGRPIAVSVNLSLRQLQDAAFVADVAGILRSSQVEPAMVILEVTESVMAEEVEGVALILASLKALGVRLAIDDFGTGYSSLSVLRTLPVDMLKVAKPFVDRLDHDQEQEAFAHAILRLGSTLRLQMVAEGIERPEQAERLRDLGCDLGQGYHFGAPLPASRLDAVLGLAPVPAGDQRVLHGRNRSGVAA